MHRNHIPEKKGTWMEEWHQKLHNNTTPDDVPICEAYLAFLEADGNTSAYWRVGGGRAGRQAGSMRPMARRTVCAACCSDMPHGAAHQPTRPACHGGSHAVPGIGAMSSGASVPLCPPHGVVVCI